MTNWYQQALALQKEAGAKESVAAMLASLLLSLPVEEAVAQTSKRLNVPVQTVRALLPEAQKSQSQKSRTFMDFLRVLQSVETGGLPNNGYGALGDHGLALGPFQIHKEYWIDSGMPGKYEQCAELRYSMGVVAGYLKRYCPKAIENGDWEKMAKTHHSIGGLNNDAYWAKFQRHMKQLGY